MIHTVLAFRPRSAYPVPTRSISTTVQQNAPVNDESKDLSNPVLEDYLKKKAEQEQKEGALPKRPSLREGTMSNTPSSLFLPEREIPGWRPNLSPEEELTVKERAQLQKEEADREEAHRLSIMNLDPDQKARRRVERKLIIAGVKRRGRMTKAQNIARTERQSLFKSKFLPTSTKKLQKVINQIAGKTVSEALVQLRFSKKKVARDVIKGLEMAQNEAITARGMGLGESESSLEKWHAQRAADIAHKSRDMWDYKTQPEDSNAVNDEKSISAHKKKGRPVMVELKNGAKKAVNDPTEIYIDQAWVGPGESGFSYEPRARGATNRLKHRTTSM